MAIIELENIRFRFPGGPPVLNDINLSISAGTLVVIAGENGSGKTTLLRHLNGLLLPDSGNVMIDGQAVSEDIRRARQLVGMVFQHADSQIVGDTVEADVAFGPENLCMTPDDIRARVRSALALVGLTGLANQRPNLLSGGEKRRLSIAGILAMEPKIVVFDEPFAGLDYPGMQQVLQEMLKLKQSGRTLLVTTHDLEKIIHHADRLIVMQAGKIVRDGIPDEVVADVESFGVRQPCALRAGVEAPQWPN